MGDGRTRHASRAQSHWFARPSELNHSGGRGGARERACEGTPCAATRPHTPRMVYSCCVVCCFQQRRQELHTPGGGIETTRPAEQQGTLRLRLFRLPPATVPPLPSWALFCGKPHLGRPVPWILAAGSSEDGAPSARNPWPDRGRESRWSAAPSPRNGVCVSQQTRNVGARGAVEGSCCAAH